MAKVKKSKRFNYNLESVLKVREIHEKLEQEKFVKAEQEFLAQKKKEEEMKALENQQYQDLRTAMGPGAKMNFHEILMRKTHLEIYKEKVKEQEQVRFEAEEKKEVQRQDLIKATQDKKVIEKDKDNKRSEWKHVMDKEEGKFLDDIASVRFDRSRRED